MDLSKHAILTNKRNATFDLHYSEFKYTTELSLWLGSFVYETTGIGFLIVPGLEAPKLGLLFHAILNLLTAE